MVVKMFAPAMYFIYTLHKLLQAGPEPTVWSVRFWPGHFLLGARPLLVNAWDWALDKRLQVINNKMLFKTVIPLRN